MLSVLSTVKLSLQSSFLTLVTATVTKYQGLVIYKKSKSIWFTVLEVGKSEFIKPVRSVGLHAGS